jgi:hypothetical protein
LMTEIGQDLRDARDFPVNHGNQQIRQWRSG